METERSESELQYESELLECVIHTLDYRSRRIQRDDDSERLKTELQLMLTSTKTLLS